MVKLKHHKITVEWVSPFSGPTGFTKCGIFIVKNGPGKKVNCKNCLR